MGQSIQIPPLSLAEGTVADDTQVSNTSSAPGATVSDALDSLQTQANTTQNVALATQYKPLEPVELTALDISNKFITLPSTPTNPEKTQLFIIGGTTALYGEDFTVSGNSLSWNGLGLDGLISAGEFIVILTN
jgi:hypothetical protein